MALPQDYVIQKFEKLFHFFNQSNTGSLTMEEFMRTSSELIKAGNVEAGTRLRAAYQDYWERMLEAAGRPKNLQTMEKADWVKGRWFVSQSDWYKTSLVPTLVDIYIGLMDKNGDGRIDIDEWRKYYRLKGIDSEEFVQTTFKKMDANGDGYITREEFAHALRRMAQIDDPENDFSFLYMRQ